MNWTKIKYRALVNNANTSQTRIAYQHSEWSCRFPIGRLEPTDPSTWIKFVSGTWCQGAATFIMLQINVNRFLVFKCFLVSPWDKTHQSCAWLCVLFSAGGSGLTNRDTCIHTARYRSWFVVWSSVGSTSGVPNRLGRDFWEDRK